MKDREKTKDQLIRELKELRNRLVQPEVPENRPRRNINDIDENRCRQITDNAPDVIWTVDMEMHLTYISPSVKKLLGYNVNEAMSTTMAEVFTEDSYALAMQALKEEIAIEGTRQSDPHKTLLLGLELKRKDGSIVPVEVNYKFIRSANGQPAEIVAVARDITKRKEAEENIKRLAYYDSITGLPNRELFNDRITMALFNARRNQHMLGVMMLDLDKFKDVNDTLGHHVGDLLLKSVGERLHGMIRKSDTIARMGGDEFLILLLGLFKEKDVGRIAEKIINSFQRPFQFNGHAINITTSIGVAIFPVDGEDVDTILKKADIAMYCAKDKGRNNYQLCDIE